MKAVYPAPIGMGRPSTENGGQQDRHQKEEPEQHQDQRDRAQQCNVRDDRLRQTGNPQMPDKGENDAESQADREGDSRQFEGVQKATQEIGGRLPRNGKVEVVHAFGTCVRASLRRVRFETGSDPGMRTARSIAGHDREGDEREREIDQRCRGERARMSERSLR